MDTLDVYYRALVDYRKNTKENKELSTLRSTIKNSNTSNDLIEITRHVFTVEEDWIKAIEEGIVHIEKAIAEERQFIRSNGEVVPIEKAKRVSKDSVSHLARHSNLITKKVDEKNLVPDQIYTVEKLSDYSVYENRFLYMLLCYLRDFISLRYDKILELSNTYIGTMELKKTISSRNQKIVIETKLKEEKKNDKYLKEHNQAKEIIDRIDLLLKTVLAYLSTPLMEEVGKTAMLKPPITKTNVLKMNKNFKGAVALYEYVSAYDKVGYSIEIQTKKISPFIDEVGEEFAEVVALTSFLTYEHGNGISKQLKANYEKEEEFRKQQESIKFQEQIKSLKKKVASSGLSMEEYMVMLERRNKSLEKDSAQLILANQEIERLNNEVIKLNNHIESLNGQIIELNQTIEEKDQEIAYLNQKYIDDMNALKQEHAEEIERINEAHELYVNELVDSYETQITELTESYETQIAELKESYETQIAELKESYETQIQELHNSYQKQIEELKESYETQIEELKQSYESQINDLISNYETRIEELTNKYENDIKELNEKHAALVNEINNKYENEISSIKAMHTQEINKLNENVNDLNSKIDIQQNEISSINKQLLEKEQENQDLQKGNVYIKEVLTDEKLVLLAQLNELRATKGQKPLGEDFTSKEQFDELEKQYIAFKNVFKKQWQATKKKIYKDVEEKNKYDKSKK